MEAKNPFAFSKGTAGISSGASSAAVRTEMAESGVQITAANAWVEKLVAGTVLAQKLFAKEITIPEGGVIQSQNFSEGTQGFRIMGNGGAEFNNGTIRGTINATGGKFENVEIQNCTGNISFTVTAGNNFILKPIKDLVPIGSGSARDSVRIVASGTIRLSFYLSCSIWSANVSCYVWKIPIKIIDRKLLVNGVQQALSGHNFNGSFVFDLPITAGETISAFADSVWSDYDEEYSIVKITAIQLLVKDNPGVLSVLN